MATVANQVLAAAVDNKSSKFGDVLSEMSSGATNTGTSNLADAIRRQREMLDNTPASGSSSNSRQNASVACDKELRQCMQSKCGEDFTKCANDTTVTWGNKLDTCRSKTTCTSHEYALIAPEIAADRDMNVKLSYYQSVLDCGTEYNTCIFAECGNALDKCIAKSDEDRAVSKCDSIAKNCREQDSGLASRFMDIFGKKRVVAKLQAEKDEARLYELREAMRASCQRLGAMFDDRTLDCVFTVNFFAGEDTSHPMASKKLYAGDSFQCTPEWFGVDVTTYKENAYRTTRAQTSASSAMLGAGLGTAAGLISSGAIDRAKETNKAKKDAKTACKEAGKTWKGGKCVAATEKPKNNKKTEKSEKPKESVKKDNDDGGVSTTPSSTAPQNTFQQKDYNAEKSMQSKANGPAKFDKNDFKVDGITPQPTLSKPSAPSLSPSK